MCKELATTMLHGLQIHAISERQCIEVILQRLERGEGGWVVTPNLDMLRRYARDESFRKLIGGADLVVADGMPLVWASRLTRSPLPGRVAGSSLISTLSASAAEAGRRIYLLGGAPGTASRAAEVLQRRHPHLSVAGTLCPPFGFEHSEKELTCIESALRRAAPDIVYVGLGSPKQEELIERMRSVLPRAWWLGIGVSFSFLCGHVRRAPLWAQRIGMEWAHRLIQEPGRLTRRYLIDGLPFAARLFVHTALGGARIKR